MEIVKKSFQVIGLKLNSDTKTWAVVGPDRSVMTLEYHPAFETLYPRNSMFPCVKEVGRAGAKYRIDWEAIYSNIYEEGCEYDFNAVDRKSVV